MVAVVAADEAASAGVPVIGEVVAGGDERVTLRGTWR
jgi:hypothetical protein